MTVTNLDYLYNPNAAKKFFDKNYFIDKPLSFSVIENGTILPHKSVIIPGKKHFGLGGIVDGNGKYIKGSSLHYGVGGAYTPPQESIQRKSETVIYLGMFYRIWGHDLTDNIRRVWFLQSETFKHDFKDCPLVYIPYEDGRLTVERQLNLKRLLEILGVDVDALQPITQPTRFDKIILPDGAFLSPHWSLKGFFAEYRETIDRVRDFALKHRVPTSAKKIYFFYGRKNQMGEERLADYFKSKGYAIVRPENLSLDEQLNILINCESFASTLGSCSHNSVFLREGTEVIIIPRSTNYPAGYTYQATLDKMNNVNEIYIDSSLSIYETLFGPYCFIISEQLKKFFGDKFDGYADDDFKIFSEYAKASVKHGFKVNETAMPSYKSTYQGFLGQLKGREDLMKAYGMNVS